MKKEEILDMVDKWEQVSAEIYDFGMDERLNGEEADLFWDTAEAIDKVVSKFLLVEGYEKTVKK